MTFTIRGVADTSIGSLNAAWLTLIQQLEKVTQDVLRGDVTARARGQSLVTSATALLQAIADESGNHPDPTLQQRWVSALQAFSATTPPSDPEPVPSGFISREGVRIGNVIIGWPVVAGAGVLVVLFWPKIRKAMR